MFKPTTDKKGIIELSVKQRDQHMNYLYDKARSQWPSLSPIPEQKPAPIQRTKSVLRKSESN